jgi:hypothetical protein
MDEFVSIGVLPPKFILLLIFFKKQEVSMKKILSVALFVSSMIGGINGAVIGHTGKHWTVTEHDRSYKVGRDCIDGTLVNVNKYNMARFLQKGRIQATKMNDGQYMLRGHINGPGGAVFGAIGGAYIAKFSVHFLGQSAMFIAAACTGPAFPVTLAALEATFIGPLEAASNVAAVGGTILGAVITGPV